MMKSESGADRAASGNERSSDAVATPRQAELARLTEDARSWVALASVLLGTFTITFWAWQKIAPISFPYMTDVIGYPTFRNYNNYAPLQGYFLGVGAALAVLLGVVRRFGVWRDLLLLTPTALACTIILTVVTSAATGAQLTEALLLCLLAVHATRAVIAYVGRTLLVNQKFAHSSEDEFLFTGAMLVVLPWLLFIASQNTGWNDNGRFIRLTWFPWQLAIAAMICALIFLYYRWRVRLKQSGTVRDALGWIFVPATIFLLLLEVPAIVSTGQDLFHFGEAIGPLARSLHGEQPWRDFLFVHGVWEDFLRFYPGQLLWERSLRAGFAFPSVIIEPLYWVSVYLLFVVVTRGNWAVSALSLLIAYGAVNGHMFRFPLYAIILMTLVIWFRSRNTGWIISFAALVTLQCVLSPEFGVVALGLGAAVAYENWLTSGSLASRFRPTFIGAGTAILVFLLFLVIMWRLGFLDGFVISLTHFSRGHLVTGGIPLRWFPNVTAIACTILLVIFAGFALVWRDYASGRSASAPVLLCGALSAATMLYSVKYFGRPDEHIGHVMWVASPAIGVLVAIVVMRVARSVEDMSLSGSRKIGAHVGAALASLAFVVGPPGFVPGVSTSWLSKLGAVPKKFIATSSSTLAGDIWAPGVATPGFGQRYAAVKQYFSTRTEKNESVFDLSDSPVLTYGILGLRPASRIMHVSMAIRPETQLLVVNDLARTKPRYVIYKSDRGLNNWDGIATQVRHHLIAAAVHRDYVFDAEIGGVTIFIRRDLSHGDPQPVPQLARPNCDLEFLPNFIDLAKYRHAARALPLGPASSPELNKSVVQISGWAASKNGGRAPAVIVRHKQQPIGTIEPDHVRADVDAHFGRMLGKVGFTGRLTTTAIGSAESASIDIIAQDRATGLTSSFGQSEFEASIDTLRVESPIAVFMQPVPAHYLKISLKVDSGVKDILLKISGADPALGEITFRRHRAADQLIVPVGGCYVWPYLSSPLTLSVAASTGEVKVLNVQALGHEAQ